LADLYPQLITGTTAQGDSLVDLGTDAESATSTLKEYLEVERQIANQKIDNNMNNLVNGIVAQNDKLVS